MNWLGGSARLNTGPDVGTEWELTVPRRGGQRWPTLNGHITVMVVDDHPIWRDAVARDLAEDGFDVVATADGVASARRRAAVVKPDVVVMDMRLVGRHGAQATAEVLEVSPSSRILVLSASDERDDVLEAVKAGADGIPGQERVEGRTGRRRCGPPRRGVPCSRPAWPDWCWGSTGGWPARPMRGPATPSLTERETEVLRYVAKGLTAKQIAERLSLSHRTVENHVQATFRKLQVANRVELARYAIEHGLDE